MKRTFKYRIYPTKSQITRLENTFSMCRYLYNWSHGERIAYYEIRKNSNFIEKTLTHGEKKVILTSCMGQLFFTEDKESAAVNTLIAIEGIFGIHFSFIWDNVPRFVNYNYQKIILNKLPELPPGAAELIHFLLPGFNNLHFLFLCCLANCFQ